MFDKFVYCPSPECMGDAEELASKYLMPIYDGQLSENLSWVDKSCASVVFNNSETDFKLSKKTFIGLPSYLSYHCPGKEIDSFSVTYENVSNSEICISGNPLIVESNYIHCFAVLPTKGKWRVFVFINEELSDSEIVEVHDVNYLL
jgi:hypothetical protein